MVINKNVKYDFSVEYKSNLGTWRIALSECVLNYYDEDMNKKYSSAIRIVNDELYVWSDEAWAPVNDYLRKGFCDYMAEKELLGE